MIIREMLELRVSQRCLGGGGGDGEFSWSGEGRELRKGTDSEDVVAPRLGFRHNQHAFTEKANPGMRTLVYVTSPRRSDDLGGELFVFRGDSMKLRESSYPLRFPADSDHCLNS